MTVPRWGQVAVRLNDGRVLIMGGTVPFVGKCAMACIELPTASVEAYDPRTGKFSPNGSLAVPLTDGEALLLNDGRVLVAGDPGGSYDSGITSSNVTLIFDPTSGGFSNGPLMARPRQGATATLLDDGRVLIVAGDDGYNGDAQDLAELIDPSHPLSQSTWPVSPGSSTSTLLSDGRVLVAGGGTEVSEVFDPRTERFTVVGPMITSRTGSAAIKIQDGRVLLLGGVDSNRAAIGTVEAFDPDSGTFQVISTAFPKITDFSATLLDDGEILIAGGWNEDGNRVTAASWLLKP
jgi:hypothetical protein